MDIVLILSIPILLSEDLHKNWQEISSKRDIEVGRIKQKKPTYSGIKISTMNCKKLLAAFYCCVLPHNMLVVQNCNHEENYSYTTNNKIN